MKKITLSILLLAAVAGAIAQTANEVVDKFIEASGGKDKLNGINTLHYNQVIKVKMAMGDFDLPLEFFKEKNKFYRMQASMQFGPQSFDMFTLVTDTAGYNMVPANPFTGAEGGIQKMQQKELTSQAYQLDAAGMFAALVDFAGKGHKAELLKDEKVNKEDCYKLKLTMNSGQEVIYFINKSTGLIARADTKGAMAASMSGLGSMMGGMGGSRGMDKMEVTTLYNEYKEVDGIKFPVKLTIQTQMGNSESLLSNIEVNKEIAAKWYKPQ